MPPPNRARVGWLGRVSEKIIYSRIVGRVVTFPPIEFAIGAILRAGDAIYTGVSKRFKGSHRAALPTALDHEAIAHELSKKRVAQANLQSMLEAIVTDVVESLGYVGAMVARYEPGGALPILAWYAKPEIAARQQVLDWADRVAAITPDRQISLTDPAIARVYVNDPAYAGNLSYKAYHQRQLVTSPDLFDLFQPITPEATRPFVKFIQGKLGVQEVIAVPFFIEITDDDQVPSEFVGNLFALKDSVISPSEKSVLQAFGRQVAAAILSDRRRSYVEAVLSLIFDIQTNFQNEAQILQRIVEGVVDNLGYAGAMVATYEPSGALPVLAWYAKPEIASRQQVLDWAARLAAITPDRRISLTDPAIARVYVNDPAYAGNLSYKAYHQRQLVTSPDLFDLFQPITPEATRPFVKFIQGKLGVRQVLAVPFFNEDSAAGQQKSEFVGNLFVLSPSDHVSSDELRVLQAFGQQAAAGIRNAQLYRQAEDRRRAAAIFGKMAFSASASIHALANNISVVRGNLQVRKLLDQPSNDEQRALFEQLYEPMFRNLDQIAETLDTLHEPWQQVPEASIVVNSCIKRAINRATTEHEVVIESRLSDQIPEIRASQDMLIEAFKVLIKNAREAVAEQGQAGRVIIISSMFDSYTIAVTISDNGVGIKRENQAKIFEMRWSSKGKSRGFGLFWTKDYFEGIGGSITLRDTSSAGTTFLVTLPVNTRNEDELEAPT